MKPERDEARRVDGPASPEDVSDTPLNTTKPIESKGDLDRLTDEIETLAIWRERLTAQIREAELCFQTSVGLSDERREALLHEGRAWHRAANAITKGIIEPS
jgi:hypothetical protein